MKTLTNEYCIKLAQKHNHQNPEELLKKLEDNLVLGYDVYHKGERVGVVFSLKQNGLFTFDAYNEGKDPSATWAMFKVGKEVMKELFDKHTCIIHTQHKIKEEAATLVSERLGFVETSRHEGIIIMAAGKMVRPHYKNMLLLSGGKDSCRLAYTMNFKNTLAFTYDQGFLSDIARENINRVLKDTGLNHMFYRANHYAHRLMMADFLAEKQQTMLDICSACSKGLLMEAIDMAKKLGIENVYTGFTKYTALAHNMSKEVEEIQCGVKVISPYKNKYDLKEVESFLKKRGFETDPLKTNCIFLKDIIKIHKERHGEHPFEVEAKLLAADGQITQDEFGYYILNNRS